MLMVVYNLGVYGISDSINSVIAMLMGSDAQEGFAKGNGNTRYYVYIRLFIIYLLFCTTHERENIMPFGVNILLHTRMEKNCTFGFAGCVVFRIDYGANETLTDVSDL